MFEDLKHPVPLFKSASLARELLIIDGLARAGKGMLAPLVSNLKRVEYAQINNPIDHFGILWKLGHLETATAAAYLRKIVDTKTYEQAIGRNLNTRMSDISSVYHALDAGEVIARGTAPEGQAAMDKYDAVRRMTAYITHSNLPMIRLWLEAFPQLKMLCAERHPIDVAASWNSRGWGQRMGIDPLALSPVANLDGKPTPWFAAGVAEEYATSSPYGRIILSLLALEELSGTAYASIPGGKRDQIRFVSFEHFVHAPMSALSALADWLDTEVPANMPVALARERVPRTLVLAQRRKKRDEIFANISESLAEKLYLSIQAYESKWTLESVL